MKYLFHASIIVLFVGAAFVDAAINHRMNEAAYSILAATLTWVVYFRPFP